MCFVCLTGIRTQKEYLITDPCILSNKAGRFGSSDCGKDYLLEWFNKHKCGQFCDPKWKKPNDKQSVAIKAVKRTSFAFETTEYVQAVRGNGGPSSKLGGINSLIKDLDNMKLSTVFE